MSIREDTIKWMTGLGFQDNSEAEIPNFTFSIKQFIEPDEDIVEIIKDNPKWDVLDEGFINLELAEYFYLKNKRFMEKYSPYDYTRKGKVISGSFAKEEEPERELIKNAFYCKKCKMTVEPKSVHDYQKCKCGNFTDGGLDYIRRGGNTADMEDRCEWKDKV